MVCPRGQNFFTQKIYTRNFFSTKCSRITVVHIQEDNQDILALKKFTSANQLFLQQDKYRCIMKEKEVYWNNKMAVFDNKLYQSTTMPTRFF